MCGDRQDHIKNDTEIYEEIYEDFYPPLMEIQKESEGEGSEKTNNTMFPSYGTQILKVLFFAKISRKLTKCTWQSQKNI